MAEYDKKHSDVTVKVVGGINDDKITAAIRSGKVPDVVSSFTSANVGQYCNSGAWIDLKPFLSKDKIDVNMFPKTSQYYTQYKGKRCALPLLADVYGFYYNKKMFKAAGLNEPAEDDVAADGVREEADEEELRRLDQGRRLQPVPRLLRRQRSGPERLRAAVRREVRRRRRQVGAVEGSGMVEDAEVAEGPRRLVRLQEARRSSMRVLPTSSRPRMRSRSASSR